MFKANAAFALTIFCASPALAAGEEESSEPGWFAQVNPATKDMNATDCACESGDSVELSCKEKSGSVHMELRDFNASNLKAGDKAAVTFEIDGVKFEREAAMATFNNEVFYPAFEIETGDPLFAAISAGRVLTLSQAGKAATVPLKGSKAVIATLMAYCRN